MPRVFLLHYLPPFFKLQGLLAANIHIIGHSEHVEPSSSEEGERGDGLGTAQGGESVGQRELVLR